MLSVLNVTVAFYLAIIHSTESIILKTKQNNTPCIIECKQRMQNANIQGPCRSTLEEHSTEQRYI